MPGTILTAFVFANGFKLEEVVLPQSQYGTPSSNQCNRLQDHDHYYNCQSRPRHVCGLYEPGRSSLQYVEGGGG